MQPPGGFFMVRSVGEVLMAVAVRSFARRDNGTEFQYGKVNLQARTQEFLELDTANK
jgi:hypothetical protein